jgi:preprotein translocase subunit SecG
MIFNTFTIFFSINSLLIIVLILNQNESTKDAVSNSTGVNSSEISNPLQTLTWISISLEFLLFLIKSKINEF